MILSLDTSVVVDLLRGKPTEVRDRFDAARKGGVPLKLSAIALSELAYGARHSDRPEFHLADLDRFLGYVQVVPFEGEDAMTSGSLRNDLQPARGTMGPADLFIAAQALGRGWAVVTSNVRHFGRVVDLGIVDWRRSDQLLSYRDIVARLTRGEED